MKNVASFQDRLGESYQKGWEFSLNNFELFEKEEVHNSKKSRKNKS